MKPQTDLFELEPRQPLHLIVSYRSDQLTVYRNGQRVQNSTQVRGDFSNWTLQTLLLGNEAGDKRPWTGLIERFALHSRYISEAEAKQRFQACHGR
jgi:hypothetical protein